MKTNNQKKSSVFRASATLAAAVFLAGCGETIRGMGRDFDALGSGTPVLEAVVEKTALQKLDEAVAGYDSKSAADQEAVQKAVYNIVFKQHADDCGFAISSMVVRGNGKYGAIGAIDDPETGRNKIVMHPNQVKMLVDGYGVKPTVTEGNFKGKVRVDYGNNSGAYHDPANFAPGTISGEQLVKMAQRAGDEFRSTNTGIIAFLNPNMSLPGNVWVNVPSETFMAGLYTREVTSQVDSGLKGLDPKYKGTAPIGGGLSLLALVDGSNANLERVGSGLPGGFQLYCKAPGKK